MKRKPVSWIVGSLLAAVAVFALMGGAYVAAANSLPPETVLTLPSPVPNAYDEFVQATRHVQAPVSIFEDSVTTDQLRKVVRDNQEALIHVRAAFPHACQAITRMDGRAEYPELSNFRAMARVFAAEGRLAEREGRYPDAARSYLDSMRLGNAIARGGGVSHYFTGGVLQVAGMRYLQECQEHLDAPTTRLTVRELQQSRRSPSFVDAVAIEREMAYRELLHFLYQHRTPDRCVKYAEDRAAPNDGDLQLQLKGWQLFLWPKQSILQNYRTYTAEVIEYLRKPYYAHPPVPPSPADPLSEDFAVSTRYLGPQLYRNEALSGVLLVQLAARAYKLEHGHLPASAKDLIPAYLNQVPDDPFAPHPIIYKQHGDHALVYSVGPDGVDDGGTSIAEPFGPGSKGDLFSFHKPVSPR